MARGPKITREDQNTLKLYESESIMDSFIQELDKVATQPYNPYAAIQSIFNNKSKYKTVDEAVQDMQNRSGLAKYLNSIKANLNKNKKTASENNQNTQNTQYKSPMEVYNKTPKLLTQYPEMAVFIENIAKETRGTSSIEGVLNILKNRLGKIDQSLLNEDLLKEFIFNKLSLYKKDTKSYNVQYGVSKDGLSEATGDLFNAISPSVEK